MKEDTVKFAAKYYNLEIEDPHKNKYWACPDHYSKLNLMLAQLVRLREIVSRLAEKHTKEIINKYREKIFGRLHSRMQSMISKLKDDELLLIWAEAPPWGLILAVAKQGGTYQILYGDTRVSRIQYPSLKIKSTSRNANALLTLVKEAPDNVKGYIQGIKVEGEQLRELLEEIHRTASTYTDKTLPEVLSMLTKSPRVASIINAAEKDYDIYYEVDASKIYEEALQEITGKLGYNILGKVPIWRLPEIMKKADSILKMTMQ
ncbi:MAG: hypothetical protein GXO26_01665 [Crenarchaeota archaeon]|nr:hypothetical protein [Thermoproteota archaeon]